MTRRPLRTSAVVLALLASVAATELSMPTAGALVFHQSAVDLGTLAGPDSASFYSFARDIDDSGRVVGWSLTTRDEPHAFRRDANGVFRDLGTLGGRRSDAEAVNNKGDVVGSSHTSFSENFRTHAFKWDGAMRDLGTLGGPESTALDINDRNQIVGWADTADGLTRAFVRGNTGGMVDIGTLGGQYSAARGINELGQVVGAASTASGAGHAFVWSPTTGMTDIGTLGGASSYGQDINERGQVVGQSTTADGQRHAFVWDPDSGMLDLGALGGTESVAHAISDHGDVVGEYETAAGAIRAFSWDASEGMVDLGTLGGAEAGALGINQDGQAVGWAFTAAHGGSEIFHAARWPSQHPIVLTTPPHGASYGQGERVTAVYACDGMASCVGDVPARSPIDTSSPGPHTFTVVGTSSGGQTYSISHDYDVRPDTAPPSVELSTPADGSVHAVGQTVTALYNCDDGPISSGMDSCVGDVPSGSRIDTSAPGSYTFAVQSADRAGNSATVVHTYHVVPRTVSIGDASVVEGDSGKPRPVKFPVTLSAPSSEPVTVQWEIRATGSASTDDVVVKSGVVTFTPSARTGLTKTTKYVTAKFYADVAVEDTETFDVVLSDPTGGYALSRSTATGTILDDDAVSGLKVGIGDAGIAEGSGGSANAVKLTVTLSSPASSDVTVQVVVTDGSASSADHDFKSPKPVTLVFRPGQLQKVVTVNVYPDAVVEPDEVFVATLATLSSVVVVRAVASVSILDDDASWMGGSQWM